MFAIYKNKISIWFLKLSFSYLITLQGATSMSGTNWFCPYLSRWKEETVKGLQIVGILSVSVNMIVYCNNTSWDWISLERSDHLPLLFGLGYILFLGGGEGGSYRYFGWWWKSLFMVVFFFFLIIMQTFLQFVTLFFFVCIYSIYIKNIYPLYVLK